MDGFGGSRPNILEKFFHAALTILSNIGTYPMKNLLKYGA
jgi:hypothetical protein